MRGDTFVRQTLLPISSIPWFFKDRIASANIVDYGSRFLVWIISLVAAFETIGNMAIALRKAELFDAAVWFAVALGIFVLAFLIERIKAFRGES